MLLPLYLLGLLLPLSGVAAPAVPPPVVLPEANPQAVPAKVTKPAPKALVEVIKLWREARFEELVTVATRELAENEKPDPGITYWRGYAYWNLGNVDNAQKDFASLGDFQRWPQYPNATVLADKMGSILALRPSLEHKIYVDEKLAFKVYYNDRTAFVDTVLNALPKGYETATTLLRKEVAEIPVFVFNDTEYERFFEFMTLFSGEPHKRWRFLSAKGSIILSQRDDAFNLYDPTLTTLPGGITHEMTHVLMRRILGKIEDLPNWFVEGAAQITEGMLDPKKFQLNDRRVQRLLADNAILPLEKLKSHASFHEVVDQLGEGQTKSSPYAQGQSMSRYLGTLINGTKFADFLELVRQKQSFDAALTELTGMTMQEFYDAWLKEVQRQRVR